MIKKTQLIECAICNKRFTHEPNHGGSIEHENNTNFKYMEIFIHNYRRASPEQKYTLFKQCLLIDDDLVNIKEHSYEVGLEILYCKQTYLRRTGYSDIAEELDEYRPNIKNEFNLITQMQIDELEKQISKLKLRFV